jgi:hypothetical protein
MKFGVSGKVRAAQSVPFPKIRTAYLGLVELQAVQLLVSLAEWESVSNWRWLA